MVADDVSKGPKLGQPDTAPALISTGYGQAVDAYIPLHIASKVRIVFAVEPEVG